MEKNRAPSWVWDIVAYAPAMALAPVGAFGVAALLGRGPRMLRERKPLAGLLVAGAAAGLARWQLGRYFDEQPRYALERRIGRLEIRRYEPRIVAETTVAAADGPDWEEALSEGFRRLAGYIYGDNTAEQKIAMTAPVNARSDAGATTVTFTMPREDARRSLPTPSDGRVRVVERPGERVAALRFRGTYGAAKKREMEAELLRQVRAAGLELAGPPVFAGYDAPSTLPFLRRVEMWVPLA